VKTIVLWILVAFLVSYGLLWGLFFGLATEANTCIRMMERDQEQMACLLYRLSLKVSKLEREVKFYYVEREGIVVWAEEMRNWDKYPAVVIKRAGS